MDAFKDKIAIVTGGASGLGRALCEELSARGAISFVADINEEKAQQVAATLTRKGNRALAVHMDVSKAENVTKTIEDIARTCGRLDYIFNNAGMMIHGEVRDMNFNHWHRIININILGILYGTTAAYSLMVRQGYGHIVNISSISGLTNLPICTAYAMTKHAVVGLSTSLRAEAVGLGVKVSVVCPGPIKTGLIDNATFLRAEWEKIPKSKSLSLERIALDPNVAARKILHGVLRNRGIIVFPFASRALWWAYRLWPAFDPIGRTLVKRFRKARMEPEPDTASPA